MGQLVRGTEVEGLLDAVHDRLGGALEVRRIRRRERNSASRAFIESYMTLQRS
jgi:hypothetical protein